ncbi:hypothetical protein DFH05DRAFT_1483627 [Lentinula detonsa]|uniref:Zinc finger C3HC4 RING-type domain-containing protein n=1 Tax=Lentinula detonsa TaxID=2804962 RepID=A0A9W8TZ78_9AGAR|nr:hypothetical protein DFH05DRAFT_1483627 [Lentinula detonsa]
MSERIGSGADGGQGKEKDKDEEREDRDRQRLRSIDRDEEQDVNKEKDEEDEEEKDNGNTGLRQRPSTPISTLTSATTTMTTATPKTWKESSTYPNHTPISPKPLPDLLSTYSLSTYNCHICFSPPTNATMTPCGHVTCGPCLFTAVKTALRRESMMMGGAMGDEGGPRCVLRRALIQGWDGKAISVRAKVFRKTSLY